MKSFDICQIVEKKSFDFSVEKYFVLNDVVIENAI